MTATIRCGRGAPRDALTELAEATAFGAGQVELLRDCHTPEEALAGTITTIERLTTELKTMRVAHRAA